MIRHIMRINHDSVMKMGLMTFVGFDGRLINFTLFRNTLIVVLDDNKKISSY